MKGLEDAVEAEYLAVRGIDIDISDVPETSRSKGYDGNRENSRERQSSGNDRSGVPVLLSVDEAMGNNEDSFFGPSTAALPRRAIVTYGTGHVLNDLTAACWFTYLLIFLTDVGLSPKQAGGVMLSGQVADGFATIIVGQLIDRFGHFKVWQAGGSILVAVSFSSVFGGCSACEFLGANSICAVTVGYGLFAAIFNVGWAATQVSHMSLVNCITANSSSRVSLNSCRNAFSMVANLFLFAVAYIIFWAFPARTSVGVHTQFRWIAWIAIFAGSCFVVVFLLGVPEPKLHHHAQAFKGTFRKIAAVSWFKKILYYQVALVYTLTRLTTNVSQALLPFFLIRDLKMQEYSKAAVPALIYICSFAGSLVLQELHWTGNRLKGVFAGGACLWIVSGAAIYLLPVSFRSLIYVVAGGIGLGNALMVVTATSLQGVLVGHNLSGCAFVYGSLSFMDKLTCGLVLYYIQQLDDETRSCPLHSKSIISCNTSLMRLALGVVPSLCAFLAALITFSMNLDDTESVIPSLRKPFLIKEDSSVPDQTDDHAPRLNNQLPVTQISRSIPRSILPPSTRSTHKYMSSTEEVDDDFKISRSVEASPLSFWQRLESAMVGRWGSIRRSTTTWLE